MQNGLVLLQATLLARVAHVVAVQHAVAASEHLVRVVELLPDLAFEFIVELGFLLPLGLLWLGCHLPVDQQMEVVHDFGDGVDDRCILHPTLLEQLVGLEELLVQLVQVVVDLLQAVLAFPELLQIVVEYVETLFELINEFSV
eukprot:CAMPEP_0116980086 /NCGR_PEP_ID=MMETSP0467-20121206/58858_1 /TAXON_ID=283647 /ORGANISM="Mesodinium pulex, Strain SPMC105" /LENGTH=142 /DNA_ID=CAMNT_0004673961 /DNA_START=378 /DNA_END=806 /DNA_ORIENTATION=-